MEVLPWVLMTLPFLSFAGQYYFSLHSGTLPLMLHHPTVMFVDWIFVPFNFVVAKLIDWNRGLRIYTICAISTVLVLATTAVWQAQGIDPGHLITKAGVVLPAGWVHTGFSIVEMVLLAALVFCRSPRATTANTAVGLAASYFIAMAFSGYIIHHRIIFSDAIVFISGQFFLFVYPRLKFYGPRHRTS